jgi:membrane protease YdiL (CAAX protease family)
MRRTALLFLPAATATAGAVLLWSARGGPQLAVALRAASFLLVPPLLAAASLAPRPRPLLAWPLVGLIAFLGVANPELGRLHDLLFRALAVALPPLLIWVGRRERAETAFTLALVHLWLTVELRALPALPLGPRSMDLVRGFGLLHALWLLAVTGRLARLGWRPASPGRALREVARNLALFAAIALAIGLPTGFLRWNPDLPGGLELWGRFLAILFLIALPEELIFRGVLQRFLVLARGPGRGALPLAALVFGAAHLNNPPMVGVYFVLATIAGWYYGRTYLATGALPAAALVHALVDFLWFTLFRP